MHKKIGKREWIGASRGGEGTFIKYCGECGKHIYFEGDKELETFLEAIGVRRRNWLKKIRFPHIKIEWDLTTTRR